MPPTMPLLTQTLDDHDVGDDPRVVSGYLTVHRRNLDVDDGGGDGGDDYHHQDHHYVGDDPRVVSGYLTVHRRQLPGAPSALPMSPDINHSPIPLFHSLLFPHSDCAICMQVQVHGS